MLTLHVCTLTHTISHSYSGISLSFHLVTEVVGPALTKKHLEENF